MNFVAPYGPDPGNASIAFTEACKGVRLTNIPGYQNDTRLFPQMQLSPEGRLCFWNWPNIDPWAGITQNIDTPLINNSALVGNYFCDSVFGDSSSTKVSLDVNPNWGYFYNIGVLPVDKFFCEDYIKRGCPTEPAGTSTMGRYSLFGSTSLQNRRNVTNYTGGSYPPGGFFSPWTGNNIVSLNGRFFYRQLPNLNMLWLNVQFMIDTYLKEPYNVKELVPFGRSYENDVKECLKYGHQRDAELKAFLSNIDFFQRPKSEKNFWDKLYSIVPYVIVAAASIITAGAATPPLVALIGGAIAAHVLKNATLINAYNNKRIEEQNKDQETRITQPSEGGEGGLLGLNKGLLYAAATFFVVLLIRKK